MTDFIILPGIGGSDSSHWQTLWERSDSRFARLAPTSWDEPMLADWIDALTRAVADCSQPPVLVAHSLGCLLTAHWAGLSDAPIEGAFLVAVPDSRGPAFPPPANDFADVPMDPLPFPALVVASSDDPYAAIDTTRDAAAAWGASHLDLGPLGHIGASSGLGDWPDGRALLTAFAAGTSRRD